jgi:NADH-quinone oxidoreductase subunit G
MQRGAQALLDEILAFTQEQKFKDSVRIDAAFCFEKCAKGPFVKVNSKTIEKANIESVKKAMIAEAK